MVCLRYKFRAWRKSSREMFYDAECTYDNMRGCTDAGDFGEVLLDEDYVVMQCTGLKDKNETLIYEGDIVRAEYPHGVAEGTVVWDYDGFAVDSKGWYYSFPDLQEMDAELEVIGNIYEVEYERIS